MVYQKKKWRLEKKKYRSTESYNRTPDKEKIGKIQDILTGN